MINRIAVLASLLMCATLAFCASDNRYNIDLELRPQQRQIRATAEVSLHAPADTSSLRFLLNKSLRVTRVKCTPCKSFRFATDEPSRYRYMRDGAPLHIELSHAIRRGDALRISISYEGSLTEPEWGVNGLRAEYTELAQYIGWFPLMPELGKFRYAVSISAPPEYVLTGEGTLTRLSPGRWRLVENAETFDIIVAAGRGLKTKSLRSGDLQVVYTPGIQESTANDVLRQMDATLQTFTSWFGPPAGGRLTLLINERAKGGSYVRPGFVSMPGTNGADMHRRIVATLGHELAHLWWTGASVVTWEDWLNESFAEYSSWLILKQEYGVPTFEKIVARARERAKDKPPVWGIDRNAEVAYSVLYDKGALLLYDLATRIGERQFLSLANAVAHMTPRTTATFLATLERATSPDVRGNFETSLKR